MLEHSGKTSQGYLLSEPCQSLREELFRRQEPQVQRPRSRRLPGKFEAHEGSVDEQREDVGREAER